MVRPSRAVQGRGPVLPSDTRLRPAAPPPVRSRAAGVPARVPRGVIVRRLRDRGGPTLAAPPGPARIGSTWGDPVPLVRSGRGWAAFGRSGGMAVVRTRFTGSRYGEVVCTTGPGERRQRLSPVWPRRAAAGIAARGRTATWSGSRDERAGRLLAWTGGFRPVREHVGRPTAPFPSAARQIFPPPRKQRVALPGSSVPNV